MTKMIINNRNINIYYNESNNTELPVIILNTFNNEGKNIWEKCPKNFILVAIEVKNWNNDLTPWECEPLFKGDEKYLGLANNYLKEIENDFIPKIEEYITKELNKKISYYGIAGYSLGGLFALYSGFNTNKFKRIASVSGSLWYPNFLEYIKSNTLSNNIDKIYFSLGKRESKSKIKLLATVEDKTKEIYNYLSENVEAIYEENEGNHFQDEDIRIIKGIKWIIEDK